MGRPYGPTPFDVRLVREAKEGGRATFWARGRRHRRRRRRADWARQNILNIKVRLLRYKNIKWKAVREREDRGQGGGGKGNSRIHTDDTRRLWKTPRGPPFWENLTNKRTKKCGEESRPGIKGQGGIRDRRGAAKGHLYNAVSQQMTTITGNK